MKMKVSRDDGFWYPCTSVQIVFQVIFIAAYLNAGGSYSPYAPLWFTVLFTVMLFLDSRLLKLHRQRLVDRMKWRLLDGVMIPGHSRGCMCHKCTLFRTLDKVDRALQYDRRHARLAAKKIR